MEKMELKEASLARKKMALAIMMEQPKSKVNWKLPNLTL